MKKKLFLLFIVVLLALSVAACGQDYEPEAIDPDHDRCDVCNMAVPNNQHATQIVTKDGKHLKFDDLGCMHQWTEENGTEDVGAQYVRDYHSKDWVNFEDAAFVYEKGFRTPMAYGVYSFKDQKSADAFVAEKGGEVIDLKQHHWKRNMEMMKKMKEKHKTHEENHHH